jgi:hypothetical protein
MPEIRPNSDFVTQITTAEAEEGKQDELLALMTERARFMARQPGFISISLHRGLDGKHIVEPGDIQAAYFLEHRSPGVWDYYSLTRTTPRFGGHVASYINRAVAAYRHIAGIPTDRDPPLAP